MRTLTILALAALAAAAPWFRPAEAATFDWHATCTTYCANVGLNDGDPMAGWFSFNDAAISPFAGVGTADVADFDLSFGTFHLTLGTSAFFHFQGILNAAATAFDNFRFLSSDAINPAWGDTIDNELIFGVGLNGNCLDAACDNRTIYSVAYFDRATDSFVLTQVPEPGALMLLGSGLVGLTWMSRRRRPI